MCVYYLVMLVKKQIHRYTEKTIFLIDIVAIIGANPTLVPTTPRHVFHLCQPL